MKVDPFISNNCLVHDVSIRAIYFNRRKIRHRQICLKIAGTKYVGLCDGILGKIGSLNVDENYLEEEVDLPIDTLVTDLTNEDNEVDEFNMNENI